MGDDIMGKAFTWTLCFDASELRNFNVNQKQGNGECLMGMFSYSFTIWVVITDVVRGAYIHIGVRLRVARFD